MALEAAMVYGCCQDAPVGQCHASPPDEDFKADSTAAISLTDMPCLSSDMADSHMLSSACIEEAEAGSANTLAARFGLEEAEVAPVEKLTVPQIVEVLPSSRIY